MRWAPAAGRLRSWRLAHEPSLQKAQGNLLASGGNTMRGSKHDLPVAFEELGVSSRQAEWGDMSVALESFPAGTDTAPIFRGLPDNRCQCPHWGYVINGRIRVSYKDREETLSAGDAYYLAPGHTIMFEQDTAVVEFSPKGEYQKTMEVAAGNIAALRQS